jgi:hypothetical protein
LDGQNLLSNDGQHFKVDAIEFVEARPGTARCKPLEELTKSLIIKTIRAVEYDTLLGNSLREIFDSFGLPC